MSQSSRRALALIPLLFVLLAGFGCRGKTLDGMLFLSAQPDGKAMYMVQVTTGPFVTGTRWTLTGDASGDMDVLVAEGGVEAGELVGLPALDAYGPYWWAAWGVRANDDGSFVFDETLTERHEAPETRNRLPAASTK